jgi:hypothetical protein
VAVSIHSLTIPIGSLAYSYWMASARASMAVFPVIVADLMRGTGRFNVAQGAIITAQGVGAALSTTLAGIVVVQAGYSAAFLTLAGVAMVGGLRSIYS